MLNPFEDYLTILFNEKGRLPRNISLISATGQVVFNCGNITSSKLEINTSALTPGTYFVLVNGKTQTAHKLVKK